MANIKTIFLDCTNNSDSFIIEKPFDTNLIKFTINDIPYWFDKSTAIKMAKTLRSEINKI